MGGCARGDGFGDSARGGGTVWVGLAANSTLGEFASVGEFGSVGDFASVGEAMTGCTGAGAGEGTGGKTGRAVAGFAGAASGAAAISSTLSS